VPAFATGGACLNSKLQSFDKDRNVSMFLCADASCN
jgi:hypothetical protein